MEDEAGCSNNVLPFEILEKIFKQLCCLDLRTCMEVCITWRLAAAALIEGVATKECQEKLKSNVDDLYGRASLSWTDFCISVSLWDNVRAATVRKVYCTDVFGKACNKVNQVQYFNNGVIAYPTYKRISDHQSDRSNTVLYLDSETLRVVDEVTYNFTFLTYEENEDMIVFGDGVSELRIEVKASKRIHRLPESNQLSNKGFFFDKKANKVFYLNKYDWISMASLVEENGEATVIVENVIDFSVNISHMNEIAAIIYTENNEKTVKYLQVLSQEGRIYSMTNKHYQHVRNIKKMEFHRGAEVVNLLKEEGFDWSEPPVYKWLIGETFRDKLMRVTPLQDVTVHPYGNIIFMGTTEGSILIYNDPYKNGELDLFKRPTCTIDVKNLCRQYLTLETKTSKNLHQYNISHIGVIEITNGHRLVAVFCGRIACIELVHGSMKRHYESTTETSQTKKTKYENKTQKSEYDESKSPVEVRRQIQENLQSAQVPQTSTADRRSTRAQDRDTPSGTLTKLFDVEISFGETDIDVGNETSILPVPGKNVRSPGFVLVVKKLFRQISCDLQGNLRNRYYTVAVEILRWRLRVLLKHKDEMNSKTIYNLYRQHYPAQSDLELVEGIVKDIKNNVYDDIGYDTLPPRRIRKNRGNKPKYAMHVGLQDYIHRNLGDNQNSNAVESDEDV